MALTHSLASSSQSQEDGGRSHGIEESEHDGWVEISDVSGMECLQDNAKVRGHVQMACVLSLKNGSKCSRARLPPVHRPPVLQSINEMGPFKVKHVYKAVVEEKNGVKVRW